MLVLDYYGEWTRDIIPVLIKRSGETKDYMNQFKSLKSLMKCLSDWKIKV